MKNRSVVIGVLLCAGLSINATTQDGCDRTATSVSGVNIATTQVKTGADGLTIEQRNIKDRLIQDNKPGAIEHLYIISAYSGQVLLYSTVRGKVTSSTKRLAPSSSSNGWGFRIPLSAYKNDEGSHDYAYTNEILGDDGTYGSSVEYIYWWDSAGIYHQLYVTGGMIVQVSSEPIAVKSVVLNLEARTAN